MLAAWYNMWYGLTWSRASSRNCLTIRDYLPAWEFMPDETPFLIITTNIEHQLGTVLFSVN